MLWINNVHVIFVLTDNVFEVRLLKNSSGLGFSFSREENVPNEQLGSSMVRVKKLFPGQPAAESGRINVGDVIMRVNQTSLKGLSQHVNRRSCSSDTKIWKVFVRMHNLFEFVCHVGGDISLTRSRTGSDSAPLQTWTWHSSRNGHFNYGDQVN